MYPTDIFEPTVVFESGKFSIVTVVGIEWKEGLDEFFSPSILESSWKNNIALNNFLINLIRVLSVCSKRQLSQHKFIQHDSHRPKIHKLIVFLSQDYFRSHVMRSTDYSWCFVFVLDEFWWAETAQMKITFFIDNEIIWLQISYNDLHFWQIFQKQNHWGNVKFSVSSR